MRLPSRFKPLLKKIPITKNRYDYGIISLDPVILYTHYADKVWEILETLKRVRLNLFITPWGSFTRKDVREYAARLKGWMEEHPNHAILHTAASAEEVSILNQLEIPAIICSHNAMVDEKIFDIKKIEREYKAIYDARITPMKRHHLAKNVNDLALITYITPEYFSDVYYEQTKADMSQATWLNGPLSNSGSSWISSEDVALHYNRAKVGLILSENEGANYASIQYLLCGLPVVTTRNVGGRDEFFSDEYVIWSAASPTAVAGAVDELIARDIDPDYIRRKTLDKMEVHRARLCEEISKCYGNFSPLKAVPNWEDFFIHKMYNSQSKLDLWLLILRSLVAQRFQKSSFVLEG
jgi:glycosyltransferase involved in cell wall biosynthesis